MCMPGKGDQYSHTNKIRDNGRGGGGGSQRISFICNLYDNIKKKSE
jgi:hypothetical protein